MKHKTILTLFALILSLATLAGPARRGPIPLTQPDETTFNALFRGDEFMKIKTTEDGHAIIQEENGWWCYAWFDQEGKRYSSGHKVGGGTPSDILAKSMEIPYSRLAMNAVRMKSVNPDSEAPIRKFMDAHRTRAEEKAVKHGLVILAQFSDVSFTFSRQNFVDLLTKEGYSYGGATGCAKEYFDAQFAGNVEFRFDVSDIITLPETRAYYGSNNSSGNDGRAAEMIVRACQMADAKTDFSLYDDDNDGVVDNVFVFFAGGDEANGAGEDCIWSHAWYVFHGAGIHLSLDGKQVDRYACTAELDRMLTSDGYKDILAGIGTFCHEYSHTFGLADMYDTDYEESGGISGGLWYSTSLMDGGNQNNHTNTPPFFNAIEREMLGLCTPETITADGSFRLEPINVGGQAYRLDTDVKDEYFLIECRSGKEWDSHIGGSGMLIYHVDRSGNDSGRSDTYGKSSTAAERWFNNEVNCNPAHQCADLLEADGRKDTFAASENNLFNSMLQSVNGVFYPYTDITSITPESNPGFRFWSGMQGKGTITNIRRDGDDILFSVVGFSEASTPPTPKNIIYEAFADAAIIQFESSRLFDGEAVVEWGRPGYETFTKTVTAYESGKFAAVLEGLEPGNKTYTVTIAFIIDEVTGESESISFMTKKAPAVTWPFIYMSSVRKNNDGSIPSGTMLPLRTYNTSDAAEISWTFDGKPVSADKTGYYEVTHSGTLRAHIIWKDGSEEIIQKELIISK